MRYPDSPFLEFGYQFEESSPGQGEFLKLLDYLCSQGGQLAGPVEFFDCEADFQKVESSITTRSDLLKAINSAGLLVSKIQLSGVITKSKQSTEILVCSPPEDPSSENDVLESPIVLWTDGSELSTGSKSKAKAVGRRAYDFFVKSVESLRPLYATITVDEPFPSVLEIRRGEISYSFQDFYVSQSLLTKNFDAIFRGPAVVHRKALSEGELMCSNAWVSPESIDNDISVRESISKAVCSYLRKNL